MRTYRRKGAMDKDRRMAVAVRLTAEGLSLREIADRLSVSHQTVAMDLRKAADGGAHHHGPTRDRSITETQVRRAQIAGVPWELVSLTVVAERDDWTCGICKKPVPRTWTDADRGLSPSLDHITPIEHGGAHLYSNSQLAHLSCNSSKGSGKREPWRGQLLSLATFSAAAVAVFEREALRPLVARAA